MVMDISLVSGLEANTEDLSTVSIKGHLPFAGDFSDRTVILTVLLSLLD